MNVGCFMKHSSNTSISDSGDYRKNFCVVDIPSLPEGEYWIIPSTFQKGDLGNFFITVESNVNFSLSAE